jgi:hypothetical protein
MSRSRSRPSKLPALLDSDQEHLSEALPEVRRLRTLQKAYAQPIIADGLFNSSGGVWWGILAVLAKEEARNDKVALDSFFERLQSVGIDTMIARHSRRGEAQSDFAIDVCNSYASAWGDSGFMLGLAVGMQLGPDALKGGAL